MENFMTVLMWLALGLATGYYAKKQGKNPYLWFFVGLFLGIFGLLLLFIISTLQKRRLQALQRQQKMQTETSQLAPAPSLPSLESCVPAESLRRLWYYLDAESRQSGPMSFDAFERDWQQGKIANSTYVWNEELPDWKPFEEVFTRCSQEEKNKKTLS